jgi:hypothetical protein
MHIEQKGQLSHKQPMPNTHNSMRFQIQTQNAPLTKIKGQNLGKKKRKKKTNQHAVGMAISGTTSITNSMKTHNWFKSQNTEYTHTSSIVTSSPLPFFKRHMWAIK